MANTFYKHQVIPIRHICSLSLLFSQILEQPRVLWIENPSTELWPNERKDSPFHESVEALELIDRCLNSLSFLLKFFFFNPSNPSFGEKNWQKKNRYEANQTFTGCESEDEMKKIFFCQENSSFFIVLEHEAPLSLVKSERHLCDFT